MAAAPRLRHPARPTTLHAALGVSAAVHAALLAVHVADPGRFDRAWRDAPLEVILVDARSDAPPPAPKAIAQASLAGGGDEAVKGRPTSPLPPAPAPEAGDADDDTPQRIAQLQAAQMQLLAQLRREVAALPPPDPQRRDDASDARVREEEAHRRRLLDRLAEIEKRVNERAEGARKRYIGPAAKEAVYAQYYDRLRRRIEERGTRDFPQAQGRKLYGELTMNLTIDAEGRVVETEIVRASSSGQLDRRAVAIVKAAAPFGPFTPAMRREADELVVTSRFRFTHEDGLETTPLASPR